MKSTKVKDLKFDKKVTEAELKELQTIVTTQGNIKKHIGALELQKFDAIQAMAESDMKLAEVQKKMKEKYGDVNVNLQDGTIHEKESKEDVN